MRPFVGTFLVVLLAVVASICAASPTRAADLGPGAEPRFELVPTAGQIARCAGRQQCWERRTSRSGWLFDFAIPIWVPGVSGSFASGGIEIEPEQGPDDMLDSFKDLFKVATDLQFGFLGNLEAKKGKWGLGLDGFGARMGTGIKFRLVDGKLVDAKYWAIILRGTVKYEFFRCPVRVPWCGRGCFTSTAVAGARYYGAGFKATLPLDVELKDSAHWMDPIVGLDLALSVSRKVKLRVEGDVGGFGVGSDFAWWLTASLDWRFARRWTLLFGYAFLETNFGDTADFAWKINLQGPILGIQYSF